MTGRSGTSEPGSDTALLTLVLSHQRQCFRRGEPAPIEAYLSQEPSLKNDADAVLDLIYNEIVLREEAGQCPRLEDYLERFPELARELKLQFEVEGAIRPGPFLKDGDGVRSPGVTEAAAAEDRPVVADFEILGELGRGGMGVVYKARQARLNRVVALKMVLAGKLASPETAARFLAEAEAIARLHHPNIVQVYASGDHDGCPYFAMEYLPGGTLADRLDNTPRPARAAAELIATLARAMAAAHRMGIVHRDLKPANILLDEEGIPKIGDFGLAKYLGADSNLTGTQAILGSPSYMAPEQAGGPPRDVGPAADVYSLGAILYELLTGRPPFVGETPLETLAQVREREPVPPSQLLRNTPRDLETICLTCLHKESPRRYADTPALADDLARFLAGEPIRARPVGRLERGWRWCRREPTRAALAGGLVAALLVGFLGIATQWQRAEANLREARLHRRNSDENYRFLLISNGKLRRAIDGEALARDRAQNRFDLAMATLRNFETATNDASVLREPQMEGLRRQILQGSLKFYQDLQASLEEDATLEARGRLADAYRRGARVSATLGLFEEALTAHRRSLALTEQMAAETPTDSQVRSTLASTHVDIGIVLNTLSRPEEALRSFERARTIQEALAGASPENLRRREQLSWTLGNIGASYLEMGRPADAARMHGEVLEIREALLAADPGNQRYRSNLAWCLFELGLAQEAFGEGGEALRLFERATAIQDDVVKHEPASVEYRRRLSHCLDSVGRICLRLGRNSEAAGPLELSAEYREVLAREHPALFRDDLAQSLIKIAKQRAAVGRHDEAAAHLRRADSLIQQTSPGRPTTVYDLGCAYSDCAGRLRDDPSAPAQSAAALASLAVARLRQAVELGFHRLDELRRDPQLDPIRADGAFQVLLLDAAFPADPFARGPRN